MAVNKTNLYSIYGGYCSTSIINITKFSFQHPVRTVVFVSITRWCEKQTPSNRNNFVLSNLRKLSLRFMMSIDSSTLKQMFVVAVGFLMVPFSLLTTADDTTHESCNFHHQQDARTLQNLYDEMLTSNYASNITVTEICPTAGYSQGCTTGEVKLYDSNHCVNCPFNHTVCTCKSCTIYGPNKEVHTGQCKPKLIEHLKITTCTANTCGGVQAQHAVNDFLSVGCFCDIGNTTDTQHVGRDLMQ
ncbi:uncharacterized protein LOC142342240 [Convolutriloba macropyga]|uniref:uncharacterized protein LOC142342240 n=1 Tax=Convolutriloba macropyga TaxID=536237 RepID=UPI003F523CAF